MLKELNKVTILRNKVGITQKELAAKVNVSTAKIVEIEKNNYSCVKYQDMFRIAEVLGTTPIDLFFEN